MRTVSVCLCLSEENSSHYILQCFVQDIKTGATTKSVCSDDRGLWVTFASVGAAVSQWPHQLCKQLVFCIWRSGWDNLMRMIYVCIHVFSCACVCVSSWLSDVFLVVWLHNCEVLQKQHLFLSDILLMSFGQEAFSPRRKQRECLWHDPQYKHKTKYILD